ncbi:hypothetical protein D9758_005710 [Tetrapyrgos nigripes]|uniref:Uncharacterized protein n=1 Tax=Tetrapyrgos nigripes TaxID=182062 RepID=A0A8H5GKC2_9AGAR|nr:hypothetical protein D9758_005710 [Tetrapyrgos nigripes]
MAAQQVRLSTDVIVSPLPNEASPVQTSRPMDQESRLHSKNETLHEWLQIFMTGWPADARMRGTIVELVDRAPSPSTVWYLKTPVSSPEEERPEQYGQRQR